MPEVKTGDKIQVHYTGKLQDGSVFDSSEGRDPLEFTVGAGQIIPGFDTAVQGMAVGDEKSAVIPSDEAYGARRDDLVFDVDKERVPAEIDPKVGDNLQLKQQDGSVVQVQVTDVGEESITLDANHPLAGQELTFDIELVAIE